MMKMIKILFVLIAFWVIPHFVYGEEFGKYTINENTRLNVYQSGSIFVAYRIRGRLIYKGAEVLPSYIIDRNRIKAAGELWPVFSFDKKYIYKIGGIPILKIKDDSLYGGVGMLSLKYKIKIA